jgi:hypothetical protein
MEVWIIMIRFVSITYAIKHEPNRNILAPHVVDTAVV